jgi:hypothetical protein
MAGTAPLKSLNAVTAPGNGTTFDVQRATSNWEVQITTTGAPASFAAHLEGAIDGSTLVTIGSSITATGLTNVTSNTPLTQVRLVLDSLTGGTAPTLTGVIVGDGPAGTSGGGGGGAATIADGADQAEGAKADVAATTDTGTFSLIALFKRLLQKFTTQFPAALGGTTAANSFPVTLASDGTYATLNGAVTEAAPATDTASSGLNGRLQRIAQRLTSLIALLPSALVSGRLDVNVGATVTPANVALDATVTTTNTEIGGLTEAAPASDTASSGLNGRLQRVAQRLTSLTALLPSALISNRLDVNLGAAPATVTAQGTAASGAAPVGNPLLLGAVDPAGGTTINSLQVQSAVSPNLRVGLYQSGLQATVNAPSADNIAAATNSLFVVAAQTLYNGTSMDRQRNNVDVTLLASAARTTLQNSANITTYNCKGIIVTLDLTASGGAISLTPSINYIDPASGKAIPLLTGTTIAATGTFTYWVNENALASVAAPFTKTAQADLGRVITINIAVGNANSQTYSVGYTLIP